MMLGLDMLMMTKVNACLERMYICQNHLDTDDHTYPFHFFHLLTPTQCMTMNGQMVSDGLEQMWLF